jgi:hypothetical protein
MFRLSQAWVLCPSLLLAAAAAFADEDSAIYRCESARGEVTYSNAACPAGTRTVRKVERKPSLVVPEPGDKSAAAPAAEAGKIAPAKTQPIDPWVENQKLNEQIAQQRRACAELERSIADDRRDLAAAAPGQAASIELRLRRAQDDFQLHCAPR